MWYTKVFNFLEQDMADPSSSDPPLSQLSQILERLRPPPWRMPQEMKDAVISREAENKRLLVDLQSANYYDNKLSDELETKKEWMSKTAEEIKAAKAWIKINKPKIAVEDRHLMGRYNRALKQQALVDKEKKLYPYEFPDFQEKED